MSGPESRPPVIALTFSLPDESREFLRLVRVSARSGAGVGSMIRERSASTIQWPPQAAWVAQASRLFRRASRPAVHVARVPNLR